MASDSGRLCLEHSGEDGFFFDAGRASAIIGILQLAEAHPQGFIGSIGNNALTAWFTANSSVCSSPTVPLDYTTQYIHQC